jgi:hypothetical protein
MVHRNGIMHSFEVESYAHQWETKSGQDFYEGQNTDILCTHIILSSVRIMTFETNWKLVDLCITH